MAIFARTIGIDYSGAQTPTASLKCLRFYLAEVDGPPAEVHPPPSPRKSWTRKGVAHWLVERLAEDTPTLVGYRPRIFLPAALYRGPRAGARVASPLSTTSSAIGRPTRITLYVDFVREGSAGKGAARAGNARWRRLTEE